MVRYAPVDHDPFAGQAPALAPLDFTSLDAAPPPAAGEQDFLSEIAPNQLQYVPVDHDPFAPQLPEVSQDGLPPVPDAKLSVRETAEDMAKSAAFRGIPEGMAAMTPLGMAGNIVSGVADATRWGFKQAYNALPGEKYPEHTVKNPVPNSSDMLNKTVKVATGSGLYEPKSRAGEASANIASVFTGGRLSGASRLQSAGAAVASEAAGEATRGSEWEAPARIAGAVLGGFGGGKLQDKITRTKAEPVTSESLRELASRTYKIADEKGGTLKPEYTNSWIEGAKSTLLSNDELVNAMKSNKPLRDAMDDLELFRNQPMTLQRAQAIDEQLGNMIDSHTELGRVTKVGRKLLDVQTQFRGMIDDVPENMVAGGKEGFTALKDARRIWADQAKLRDVEKIITRAEQMDNPATGIKTGFRTLYSNDKRMRGFSKAERALIKHAAETGKVTDALRTMGSRLITVGGIVSGNGIPAAIATQVGTSAARGAAAGLQMKRATRLTDKITEKYKPAQKGANQLLLEKIKNKKISGIERPEVKAPEPMKLLPAPKYEILTDSKGTARPQTPIERQAAIAARKRDAELGLTPDIRKVVSTVERRLKTDDAWNKITEQQRQQINQQIEEAWKSNKAPVEDIIKAARQQAAEIAKAKGEKFKPTPFGEKLLEAAKNPKSSSSPHIIPGESPTKIDVRPRLSDRIKKKQ